MNSKNNTFKGRSFTVAADFSLDEWLYIFSKTYELKKAIRQKDKLALDSFRIADPDFGVYLAFLENSTRTDNSFRNATEFHRVKLNLFDQENSSRKKKESYADTFNTLTGYGNNLFIIRSSEEGLCRWLQINGKKYAEKHGIEAPAFINAGDGQHEHPTQELLDQFTFWEANKKDTSDIHIALIGDLLHGRTIHSKADGLRLYNNVKVDLIAPDELAMPDHYIQKMKDHGFEIKEFGSLEEYYSQEDHRIAAKQYFTRLQLERMGDEIKNIEQKLRSSVTFKEEYIALQPEDTKFYHPLPRHKNYPTIPRFLDSTSLNGYEEESINGYLSRIILESLIAGKIGEDFEGKTVKEKIFLDDFIEKTKPKHSGIKDYKEGIRPIEEGIVIDHVCRGDTEREIWSHLAKIMNVMDLYSRGWVGVDESKKQEGIYKGLISLPNHKGFDEKQIKKLGALSPGSTINIIEDEKITRKLRLGIPPRIYGFNETSCKNPRCIAHPDQEEYVPSEMIKMDDGRFSCKYCETPHTFKEIWK